MNHKKFLTLFIIILSVGILTTIIIYTFHNRISLNNPLTSSLNSLSTSSLSNSSTTTSKSNIIENFKKNNANYKIIDYSISTLPSSVDTIQAIISYYDNDKKTKTNIAVVTENGIGLFCLQSDSNDFEFADSGKVKIISKNQAGVSLLNTKSNKILDYVITYTYNSKNIDNHFKIDSKSR